MRMSETRRRKFGKQGAVTINTTLPAALVPELEKIIVKFGFKGPADYLQNRIRMDAGLVLSNGQNPN